MIGLDKREAHILVCGEKEVRKEDRSLKHQKKLFLRTRFPDPQWEGEIRDWCQQILRWKVRKEGYVGGQLLPMGLLTASCQGWVMAAPVAQMGFVLAAAAGL